MVSPPNTASVTTLLVSLSLSSRAIVQGAANKSNPLPCFVNISTTNTNFYKKIYTTIYHSYLRIVAELYSIITQFG